MTCIVGLAHGGKVYMGGDSASVQGWTRRQTALKKVFRRGPFLIGYTSSFRMGQLLEHHLDVPKQKATESDMSYMVTGFIESTRKLLKEKGFTKVESNAESGGQFLVGYRGSLYTIHRDFQVGQAADGLDAVGSGREYALGAMQALSKLPPARRIKKALEITAYFNAAVAPPFVVRQMS
jgi:ATP-dependent protease HslVU (ClpYQ) peptidase subunit